MIAGRFMLHYKTACSNQLISQMTFWSSNLRSRHRALRRRHLKTVFALSKPRRKLKTQQSPVILDLCSRKTRHRFRKAPFSNCFPSTLKREAGVFKYRCIRLCKQVAASVVPWFSSLFCSSGHSPLKTILKQWFALVNIGDWIFMRYLPWLRLGKVK